MCLILFAYRVVPERPLVLAANRDEFYARPASEAHWWEDAPNIYGGRDRQAHGTWLAVSRDGRLAAVTNWTERERPAAAKSRGGIPRAFLDSPLPPCAFAQTIDGRAYSGFNFMAYDGEELAYASNRTGEVRTLAPGFYGLTNTRLGGAVAAHPPDSLLEQQGSAQMNQVSRPAPRCGSNSQPAPQNAPSVGVDEWPKATLGAWALREVAASATIDDLLALLGCALVSEDATAQPCEHNSARRGTPQQNRDSPAFLRGAEYGTRASTAVIFERGEVLFAERQYGPFGIPGRQSSAAIALTPRLTPKNGTEGANVVA